MPVWAVAFHGVDIPIYVTLFLIQVMADGGEEFRPRKPMRRPGADRHEATADLMLALRPRLEAGYPVRDTVVDALVITGLEVQCVVVRFAAPVTSVECVPSLVENSCRDGRTISLRKDKELVVRQQA